MVEKKIKNLTSEDVKVICRKNAVSGKDCDECPLARIEKQKVFCLAEEMEKTVKINEVDYYKRSLYENAIMLVGKKVKILVNDVIVKDKIPDGMFSYYYGFLDIVSTTHIVLVTHCGRTLIKWEAISKLELMKK